MTDIFVNIPEGHTILCGWNSHALQIVKELEASGHPVVVICTKRPLELKNSTMPVVEGDCSADDVLKKAGVETATSASRISVLPTRVVYREAPPLVSSLSITV